MRLGIAHQPRGVHEREADPLTVVGELRAVEVGAEMTFLDSDASGAGERVHPVAQVLDDVVAHWAGPVVQLDANRAVP